MFWGCVTPPGNAMSHCYSVALGANLGDARETFVAARQAFTELHFADPDSLKSGGLYETDPVGCPPDSPSFLNSAIQIRIDTEPDELLETAREIEIRLGRTRPSVTNAPRIIDIDLLLADDIVFENADLSLPHPQMHERAFVLCPLADINPELTIPGRGTVAGCLQSTDTSGVRLVTNSW